MRGALLASICSGRRKKLSLHAAYSNSAAPRHQLCVRRNPFGLRVGVRNRAIPDVALNLRRHLSSLPMSILERWLKLKHPSYLDFDGAVVRIAVTVPRPAHLGGTDEREKAVAVVHRLRVELLPHSVALEERHEHRDRVHAANGELREETTSARGERREDGVREGGLTGTPSSS